MSFDGSINTESANETDHAIDTPLLAVQKKARGRLIALATVVIVAGALTSGVWNHFTQYRVTAAAAAVERDLVPQVRVAAIEPSTDIEVVNLPATTSAFASANIFARASGYVGKREVDIGDRVKAGQLLAEIVAPELNHQIAQAEATLAQLKSALQQADRKSV